MLKRILSHILGLKSPSREFIRMTYNDQLATAKQHVIDAVTNKSIQIKME